MARKGEECLRKNPLRKKYTYMFKKVKRSCWSYCVEVEVIYQTRETVFHWDIQNREES